ncbi:MAG: PepSY-associated TM helix domain-containing protein [Bryobacterales bacterium]|nr:PepSY-associated TM helix domain-containing protein [Bryobacterales bacterium]
MSKSHPLPLTTEKQRVEVRLDPSPRSSLWKRRLAAWSRWLHIYLSMVSFAILFFFAATGITLNHPDWFGNRQSTAQHRGVMQPGSQLQIVEHLRDTHAIRGALSDFRTDDTQYSVSFKGPGYAADAFIDRATGKYELTETRMGLIAVINDLHKGRDTGKSWSAIIDISAALMCFVSLSGLILIFFLSKKRASGLYAALIGAALCYAVYAVWVP